MGGYRGPPMRSTLFTAFPLVAFALTSAATAQRGVGRQPRCPPAGVPRAEQPAPAARRTRHAGGDRSLAVGRAHLTTALRRAAVAAVQRTYPGVTHEFFGMGSVVRGAARPMPGRSAAFARHSASSALKRHEQLIPGRDWRSQSRPFFDEVSMKHRLLTAAALFIPAIASAQAAASVRSRAAGAPRPDPVVGRL